MSIKDEITQESAVPEKQAQIGTMGRDIRDWGVGLVVMGIIHFVLAGSMDPVWGVILVVIGAVCLFVRHRGMYIVIGVALVIVGSMNFVAVYTGLGAWSILGVLQIGFGVHQIPKYWKHGAARGTT